MNAETCLLSIIVCTYRRPDHLARLLESLKQQMLPLAAIEVIVVDNDLQHNAPTVAVCDRYARDGLNVRCVHEPVAGASQARNRGVQFAHAELIGFTDDDCQTLPHWARTAVQIQQITQADLWGGPFEPFYLDKKPAWFQDTYLSFSYGSQPFWLTSGQALVSGNMFWRKSVFEALGGFSPNYGYIGSLKIFGEDTEICQRALRQGYKARYEPDLMIKHYAEPQRLRLLWQLQTKWRRGTTKGLIQFEGLLSERRSDERFPITQLWQVMRLLGDCLWALIRTPFRNTVAFPYYQNHLIEEVGPRLGRLASAATILRCYINAHFQPKDKS